MTNANHFHKSFRHLKKSLHPVVFGYQPVTVSKNEEPSFRASYQSAVKDELETCLGSRVPLSRASTSYGSATLSKT